MWTRLKEFLQIVAMPLAIGTAGYFVQGALQDDQLRSDRLKLAVGILTDAEASPSLKRLGVDMLSESLPTGVTMDAKLRVSLAEGETNFPKGFTGYIPFEELLDRAKKQIDGEAPNPPAQ